MHGDGEGEGAPRRPAISASLKGELQKRVKSSEKRMRARFSKQNVAWDLNNSTREKRSKPFEYKTNAGVEMSVHQIANDVGGVVWTAAIQLSKYLEKRHEAKNPDLAKTRVLELGSGTGMVGIIAAALGANVTLTDLPNIVTNAAKNVEINKKAIESGGGKAIAVPFTWGNREAKVFKDDIAAKNPPYDLILASDVVYTKESGDLLLDAMDQVFSSPSISHKDTVLLLAGDLRGRVGRSALLEAAAKKYDVQKISEEQMDQGWMSCNIEIHSIRRKKSSKSS